jgi:hypothetical protein
MEVGVVDVVLTEIDGRLPVIRESALRGFLHVQFCIRIAVRFCVRLPTQGGLQFNVQPTCPDMCCLQAVVVMASVHKFPAVKTGRQG